MNEVTEVRSRFPRLAIATGVAAVMATLFIWAWAVDPATVVIEPTRLSGMVFVAGGTFDAGLPNRVRVEPFWIDRFEVSESKWQRFRLESSHDAPEIPVDEGHDDDFPVRYVTFADSLAYAVWHFKTLPTNLQWERASRGRGGAAWPWGHSFIPVDCSNSKETWWGRDRSPTVTRVGTFELGKSHCGAYDMIGNVWEWTRSEPVDDPLYLHAIGGNASVTESLLLARLAGEPNFVIRGGSFNKQIGLYRPVRKPHGYEAAQVRKWDLGFRCVVTEEEVQRQQRLIPLIRDLGYRDPWRLVTRTWPATRTLARAGREALRYLHRARAATHDSVVRNRIDDLVRRIEEQG